MITKKRVLLTLFVLILLVNFNTYFIPKAQAAEPDIQQKTVSITTSVLGVDTPKYSPATQYNQSLYLDAAPQDNIRYTLETQGSKLDLYYTFVNGKLQKIHVLETQGKLQMQKSSPASSIEKAKDFLESYSEYTKNTFYKDLYSMLLKVEQDKNTTLTQENIKLSVTTLDTSTTYRWIYTLNGVEAGDKCVVLNFDNAFLGYFIDNWDLYKIGSTSVNVSEQQAIDVAITKAKDYTWATVLDNKTVDGLKYNVTNAMVLTTSFSNSFFMDNPRDKDPLVLYPMRYVWVSFDKFYPGNVYGMNVYVWADTGEIGHMQERFSTIDPPTDLVATEDDIARASNDQTANNDVIHTNLFLATWILLPISGILIGLIYVRLNKNRSLPKLRLPRKFSALRFGRVIILCVLMGSTVFVDLSISTVNALPYSGRATVWGSESSGAWNSTLNQSWRKHPDEVSMQQSVSAFLQSEFDSNGYYASNYQGSQGSDKSSILTQIQANGQNYARIAVVDFNHGNGNNETNIMGAPGSEFHYMFEDQTGTRLGGTSPGNKSVGNGVYDMEIYNNTVTGRYFFVLINACNSAHIEDTMGDPPNQQITTQGLISGRARGMPFAWSHGIKVLNYGNETPPSGWMSGDGYAHPDSGQFVYLGFRLGSAALTQVVTAQNQSMYPYWWWLEHFFAYALTNNWSVKQALDEASQQIYGINFDQAYLHTGYDSIWPMFYNDTNGGQPYWHNGSAETGAGSKLVVYGNSNLKLYQPTLNVNAYDNNNNQISPTFSIDGNSHASGNLRLYSGSHSISVNDIPGYTFLYFTFNGQTYYSRPVTLSITADSTITAHYQYQPPRYLTISSNGSGSTNPGSGVHQYFNGETATVTATPSSLTSKVLNNWLLDNQNIGNALSVDVYMGGDHTLSANFADAPSPFYPYAYNIQSYTNILYLAEQPWSMTGFQPDGFSASLQSFPEYGDDYYGQITASMNTAGTGHVWVYGSGYGTLQVDVSNNGGGWTSLGSTAFTSTSHWVDCGIAWSPFNIITLTAGGSPGISVDSIKVTPIVNYTLTVNSATGGYTNTSTGSYTETTVVNVQAAPSSGYYFDYWDRNGTNVGSSNPLAVTMNNNYVLTPVFTRYSLTISSTTGGSTNPTAGIYNYTSGQTQTVNATAGVGYRFDHWELDNNPAGTSTSITVTMDQAHTLQAVFSPLATYTLSVDAWCDEGFQLYPTLYVDGTPYYGTVSISVYAGYHTIGAESPYYDCFFVSGFSDGLGNGASRNILSNTHVTAYYYRAW